MPMSIVAKKSPAAYDVNRCMQDDLAAPTSSSRMRAYAPRAFARRSSAICPPSFQGWEGSNRSKPAGTPWADAGKIGVAVVSAMNASDPQRTPNTRPCLARVIPDASLEKLMSFIRVFWRTLKMMISLSVDAPFFKAI
jgi:hypothetical protein